MPDIIACLSHQNCFINNSFSIDQLFLTVSPFDKVTCFLFFFFVTDAKEISWGCIEASCKKECTEMVAKGLADIVDLNATDMFLAGLDYNLIPFMAENYKG